jgi:hypothetical protein
MLSLPEQLTLVIARSPFELKVAFLVLLVLNPRSVSSYVTRSEHSKAFSSYKQNPRAGGAGVFGLAISFRTEKLPAH